MLEAFLTSTHNLCFGAKIRRKVYPCKPKFYYIKVGCKGVFVTRTCFRDDNSKFLWPCYFAGYTRIAVSDISNRQYVEKW